jgi:hypothetical protein
MSKRPTKKAAKKAPAFSNGQRVKMVGKIVEIESNPDGSQHGCWVQWDGDNQTYHQMKALRPAVEVFAWKPEKVAKKKAGKK